MFKKLSKLFSSSDSEVSRVDDEPLHGQKTTSIDGERLQDFTLVRFLGAARSITISCVHVDTIAKIVVYGTHTGSVYLFSIDSGKTQLIFDEKNNDCVPPNISKVFVLENSGIVAVTRKNRFDMFDVRTAGLAQTLFSQVFNHLNVTCFFYEINSANFFIGLDNGVVRVLNVVAEDKPYLSSYQITALDTHGETKRREARTCAVLCVEKLHHSSKPALLIAYSNSNVIVTYRIATEEVERFYEPHPAIADDDQLLCVAQSELTGSVIASFEHGQFVLYSAKKNAPAFHWTLGQPSLQVNKLLWLESDDSKHQTLVFHQFDADITQHSIQAFGGERLDDLSSLLPEPAVAANLSPWLTLQKSASGSDVLAFDVALNAVAWRLDDDGCLKQQCAAHNTRPLLQSLEVRAFCVERVSISALLHAFGSELSTNDDTKDEQSPANDCWMLPTVNYSHPVGNDDVVEVVFVLSGSSLHVYELNNAASLCQIDFNSSKSVDSDVLTLLKSLSDIDKIECSCSNDGTRFALIIGGTLSNKKHGVFVIGNENDENTFKLILASFDDENDSDDESDSDDKSDNDDDENNSAGDKNDDENTNEQNVVTETNETKDENGFLKKFSKNRFGVVLFSKLSRRLTMIRVEQDGCHISSLSASRNSIIATSALPTGMGVLACFDDFHVERCRINSDAIMCFKIRDAIDTAWYVELIARCSSNDDAAADADTTLDAIYVVCGRQVHLFESILDNHTDNSNDNNTSKKIDENNQSNNNNSPNNNNNVATMKFARRLLTGRLIRAATLAHDNRLLLVDSRDVVHSFTAKLKPLRKACLRDVCNSSPRIAFCCDGNNDGNLLAFAHNVVALVSLNNSSNNNIDDDNDETTDDNIDNHHHQLMVNPNQVLYEKRKQIDLKKKHGGGGGGVFNSLLGTTRKREKAAQDLLDAKATTPAITRAAPTPHAKSAASSSEATRDVLEQTKQKIADNVEKAKDIEQSTAELEQESNNFAQLSKSIADAQKSKSSFFGL